MKRGVELQPHAESFKINHMAGECGKRNSQLLKALNLYYYMFKIINRATGKMEVWMGRGCGAVS